MHLLRLMRFDMPFWKMTATKKTKRGYAAIVGMDAANSIAIINKYVWHFEHYFLLEY